MDSNARISFSNFHPQYIPSLIIGAFGVVLHVLLLIVFIKDPLKCFRNSATYLVANLAVSDLIASLIGPYLILFRHWILYIITVIALGVSLVAIVSIAADRYLMVAYPFKHHYLMSGKKIIIWITIVWILISSCGVAAFFLFPMSAYSFSVDICVAVAVAIVTVTGVLYVLTCISLRRQTRNLALHNASGSNRSEATRLLKEKQFVRTILLVACIAVIGIMPYSITFYIVIKQEVALDKALALNISVQFLAALYFFTFAINPFIYFVRLPRYRKSFCLLYCRRHSN